MFTVRKILHPTDFSPSSELAFEAACALARDRGAELVVLHVVEVPLSVPSGVMTAPPAPIAEADRGAALAKLRAIKPADGMLQVHHRLEMGDVAQAILSVAKEIAADLIVLGTHGRTGLSRLLMGSVAEKVVRSASCPVLTLRAPE